MWITRGALREILPGCRVMTGENSVRAFFKRLTKDWKTDLDAR